MKLDWLSSVAVMDRVVKFVDKHRFKISNWCGRLTFAYYSTVRLISLRRGEKKRKEGNGKIRLD